MRSRVRILPLGVSPTDGGIDYEIERNVSPPLLQFSQMLMEC